MTRPHLIFTLVSFSKLYHIGFAYTNSCLPGMEIHKVRRPLMGLWRAARDSVEAVADYAFLIVRLLVPLRPWRLLVSFETVTSV